MSPDCYNSFYSAFDAGWFYPDLELSVMLTDNTYEPQNSHEVNDVTGIILIASNVLKWSEFQANGMGEIMELLTNRMEKFKADHPELVVQTEDQNDVAYYVVYSSELNILCFCEDAPNL